MSSISIKTIRHKTGGNTRTNYVKFDQGLEVGKNYVLLPHKNLDYNGIKQLRVSRLIQIHSTSDCSGGKVAGAIVDGVSFFVVENAVEKDEDGKIIGWFVKVLSGEIMGWFHWTVAAFQELFELTDADFETIDLEPHSGARQVKA